MITTAKLDEILFYKGSPGRVIQVLANTSKSATLKFLEEPLKGTRATIKFKNLTREDE